MPTDLSRRAIVGSVGAVALSGCLESVASTGNESEPGADEQGDTGDRERDADAGADDEQDDTGLDDEQNDTDDRGRAADAEDHPEECLLENRDVQGQGDPIETALEATETDDVSKECAGIAADAALEAMDERLGLDLEEQTADAHATWISAGVRYSGQLDAFIDVMAIKSNELTGDGSYLACPPPEFDFDEAVEAVPGTVTVTLQREDGEHECSHEISVRQETRYQD